MTGSKMSTANIFKKMYEKVLDWDNQGGIPPRMKDVPITHITMWYDAKIIPITYDVFEYMIKEVLELSSLQRTIRETWNYLIRQQFIFVREVNQHRSNYLLNMIEIRYMLKVDGQKELERLENDKVTYMEAVSSETRS